MKKLFVALFSFSLSCALYAQAPSKLANSKTYEAKDVLTENSVTMTSGKVVMMKNGQAVSPLTKEIKMANGTSVTPEGVVTRSDGSTAVLKEGEYVMMNGSTNKKLSWKSATLSPKIKSNTLK